MRRYQHRCRLQRRTRAKGRALPPGWVLMGPITTLHKDIGRRRVAKWSIRARQKKGGAQKGSTTTTCLFHVGLRRNRQQKGWKAQGGGNKTQSGNLLWPIPLPRNPARVRWTTEDLGGASTRNPLPSRGTARSQDRSVGGILRKKTAGNAVQRNAGDKQRQGSPTE